MLVSSIQAVNALLGCLSLSWPYTTTPLDAISLLKVYGQMVMVVGQGLITATGVALVEELLFRSWLPEEIAADLGYHRGIIISGLVFSLLQRWVYCCLFEYITFRKHKGLVSMSAFNCLRNFAQRKYFLSLKENVGACKFSSSNFSFLFVYIYIILYPYFLSEDQCHLLSTVSCYSN